MSKQVRPRAHIRSASKVMFEEPALHTTADLSSQIISFRQNSEVKGTIPKPYRRTQSSTTTIATQPALEPLPIPITPRPQSCLRLHALLPLVQETVSKRHEMGPIVRAVFRDGEKANQYVNLHHISHVFLTGFQEDLNIETEDAGVACQKCLNIMEQYGNFSIMRRGKLVPLIWPTEIKAGVGDYYRTAVEAMVELWNTAILEAPESDGRVPFDGIEAGAGGIMTFGQPGHFTFEIGPTDKRWPARFKRSLITCENSLFIWVRGTRNSLHRGPAPNGFGEKEKRRSVVKRYAVASGRAFVEAMWGLGTDN